MFSGHRLRLAGLSGLALLMSAALNVVIAWTLAYYQDPDASSARISWQTARWNDDPVVNVTTIRRFGATRCFLWLRERSRHEAEWRRIPDDALPGGVPVDEVSPGTTIVWDVRGWPLRCMSARWIEPADSWNYRDGFLIGRYSSGWPIVLPIRPVWIPFFVNVALIAGVAGLVLRLSRYLRCRKRLHLGKCLSCGYSLEGLLSCPECGATASTRSVQRRR
jgi:hypothetical protein